MSQLPNPREFHVWNELPYPQYPLRLLLREESLLASTGEDYVCQDFEDKCGVFWRIQEDPVIALVGNAPWSSLIPDLDVFDNTFNSSLGREVDLVPESFVRLHLAEYLGRAPIQ